MRRRSAGTEPWMAGACGLALGAGLMYLLDPARGRGRRARLRDKMVHAEHELEGRSKVAVHDLANRAQGLAHDLATVVQRDDGVDDDVLVARVRARVGRAIPHPGGIEVTSERGTITLRGPVLRSELDTLLHEVRRVRGVRELRQDLTMHDEPGTVPALQGAHRSRHVRISPSTKLLAAVSIGAFAATSLLPLRRG